jgi:hypothetical protein
MHSSFGFLFRQTAPLRECRLAKTGLLMLDFQALHKFVQLR